MQKLETSGFPFIEPDEADPEVAQLYRDLQRETDSPEVPDWAKVIGVSPGSLKTYLGMLQAFNHNFSLPQSIVPMILYSIATARNCDFCRVSNELFCRAVGVDDETLEMLANDLDRVSPERLRAMLQFAVQCATDSHSLAAADYDRMREEGVSDDELLQIIFLAALANFNHTVDDSLKLGVDPEVFEALGY